MKSSLILPGASICNQTVPPLPTSTLLFIYIVPFIHECSPKCTPNAHKLFSHTWCDSQARYACGREKHSHAHMLHFLLNPMIGVVSSCDDDKLTEGLTLLPNSLNTNHRQTSDLLQSVQLKDACTLSIN